MQYVDRMIATDPIRGEVELVTELPYVLTSGL